ncbi:MAG: hypothetical protein WAW80_05325 [Candidatus Saccharimonadales bacterium]
MQNDNKLKETTMPTEPTQVDIDDVDFSVHTEVNQIEREPTPEVQRSVILDGQPVHASHFVQETSKPAHRGLIMAISSLILVITIIMSGFSYWYFGIHTADI